MARSLLGVEAHQAEVRPLVDLIGSIEFRRGVLAAHAGSEPFERCDTLPAAVAVAAQGGGVTSAEPSRTEPSRTGPSRTGPSRADVPLPDEASEASPGVDSVPSLLALDAEATCLVDLARNLRGGRVVECFEGAPRVALDLTAGVAESNHPGTQVLAIGRPPSDSEERRRALECFARDPRSADVRLVEMPPTSVVGWAEEIGMLVVSCDLPPIETIRLLETAEPVLRDGALIALLFENDVGEAVPERLDLGGQGTTQACQSVGRLHVHRYRRSRAVLSGRGSPGDAAQGR